MKRGNESVVERSIVGKAKWHREFLEKVNREQSEAEEWIRKEMGAWVEDHPEVDITSKDEYGWSLRSRILSLGIVMGARSWKSAADLYLSGPDK